MHYSAQNLRQRVMVRALCVLTQGYWTTDRDSYILRKK
ncbi:Uncharacterized protein dnm_007060 [Desulfonema magnum]|uniref:Uncharacterized protein n=1 Tax=Desulfonema magnum TaxID=45655 RepID=A0A975BFZ1_9BACT|nr:Uncharacterized protein dnm_007060 [Desulfonema magnum]